MVGNSCTFGRVDPVLSYNAGGVRPIALGGGEVAARELGLSSANAVMLQRIAALQLGMAVSEPVLLALAGWALAALTHQRRRLRQALGSR